MNLETRSSDGKRSGVVGELQARHFVLDQLGREITFFVLLLFMFVLPPFGLGRILGPVVLGCFAIGLPAAFAAIQLRWFLFGIRDCRIVPEENVVSIRQGAATIAEMRLSEVDSIEIRQYPGGRFCSPEYFSIWLRAKSSKACIVRHCYQRDLPRIRSALATYLPNASAIELDMRG